MLSQSDLEVTANGLKVDGSATVQPVSYGPAATAVVTPVPAKATTTLILAANPSRKAVIIFNDAVTPLYIKFGDSVSGSDFSVKLQGQEYYELPQPVYSGDLTGVWDGTVPTGFARVTELS
jgi:hypothetical protein